MQIKAFPLFVVAEKRDEEEVYYTGRSENAVYPKKYEFTKKLSHAKFFNHEGYARAAIRYHKWPRAYVRHFFVEGELQMTLGPEKWTKSSDRPASPKKDHDDYWDMDDVGL